MAPQVRGVFPLGEALQLAEALGYGGTVMAELLSHLTYIVADMSQNQIALKSI